VAGGSPWIRARLVEPLARCSPCEAREIEYRELSCVALGPACIPSLGFRLGERRPQSNWLVTTRGLGRPHYPGPHLTDRTLCCGLSARWDHKYPGERAWRCCLAVRGVRCDLGATRLHFSLPGAMPTLSYGDGSSMVEVARWMATIHLWAGPGFTTEDFSKASNHLSTPARNYVGTRCSQHEAEGFRKLTQLALLRGFSARFLCA
jgi:hypothetical protein